jgi:GT2 family glycosyltransferase
MSGSILIVSRNSIALTKRTLRSAADQDVPCDILVVDNFSTDGTQEWLRTKNVATVMLQSQESLAACWNRGLKAFWNIGSREVLVINNDVVLRPDTYRLLVSCQEPFITGVSVDKESQMGNVGDRSPQELMESATPHPCFSCYMIRRDVWDKGFRFDESYFPAYAEDSKAHVTLHRMGIRVISVNLPFYHEACGTLKNCSPVEKARIERGAQLNREKFKKEFGCYPGSREYDALFKV